MLHLSLFSHSLHSTRWGILLLAVALACAQLTASAQSKPRTSPENRSLQEVSELLRQGQLPQALERADRIIATQPDNARARFLKGVILTDMARPDEALAVFTKLTEDFPELPEPYNNLAVIHARQQHYDKAQGALEMAIRANPGYAVAHENLGDLYLRRAGQSYDKALQLDKANAGAQKKLAAVRDLLAAPVAPPAK